MAIIRHASSFKSGLDKSERLLIVVRRRLYRTYYALSDKIPCSKCRVGQHSICSLGIITVPLVIYYIL